ncbi:MAG: class I SAM-dependent methyltransferase [Planctomycetota bacterium]|jgi:ubiquinone/menaquinone biosynthesis C-methylase UbiE
MDPRERFAAAADDYHRYRPDYPTAIPELVADYNGQTNGTVADIGCGTGISSRLFAKSGFNVIGIEPSAEMRAKAEQTGGGLEYRDGEAIATGLADESVDVVMAAQALHWFELEPTLDEWQRILKASGSCAAFWNYRTRKGWQSEYEDLLLEWSSEYEEVSKAIGNGDDNSDKVKSSPRCKDISEHNLENHQLMDWETLVGRARSSSYVIHGVEDKPGFEAALKALFEKHQFDGQVKFLYDTYLLQWRL